MWQRYSYHCDAFEIYCYDKDCDNKTVCCHQLTCDLVTCNYEFCTLLILVNIRDTLDKLNEDTMHKTHSSGLTKKKCIWQPCQFGDDTLYRITPGTISLTCFVLTIQIRRKLRLAAFQLLVITSQLNCDKNNKKREYNGPLLRIDLKTIQVSMVTTRLPWCNTIIYYGNSALKSIPRIMLRNT